MFIVQDSSTLGAENKTLSKKGRRLTIQTQPRGTQDSTRKGVEQQHNRSHQTKPAVQLQEERDIAYVQ